MTLPPENVRVLEQARNRLIRAQAGLDVLRDKLLRAQQANDENGPLPSWQELQASAETFTRNMGLIQETFDQNREFLTAAHAYPHANFPATKPQGHATMTELLRKKPEPEVEAWMKEYTDPAKVRRRDTHIDDGLSQKEQVELWQFASPTSKSIANDMLSMGAFEYDYTLAEHAEGVAKVRTGLRRKLDLKMHKEDEESEDEEMEFEDVGKEEGDKAMEDVMPALPPDVKIGREDRLGEVQGLREGGYAMRLDDVLKFVSMGVLPAGRA